MIVSRTPVRLSFFGGGTDYKEYYRRKGGAVLGTTIDKYVYVSISRISPFFEYRIRVGYSKAELVNSVDDIIHPSVRECLRFKKMDGNLDIHIFADLPAKTGLGSSSAFTVGFLNALYALDGKVVSKQQLAEEAIYVEQEMIKENVGSQDQVHAAFGGINVVRFSSSSIQVNPLVIDDEKRSLLEQSLMVFFTGLTRHAHEVVKEQIEKTVSTTNDEYLDVMYQMVDEAVKVCSDCKPEELLPELGKMMNEGWRLKKSLSSKITNSLIDDAYLRALKAGAYGGKLSGAGGGGFLTLLVHPDQQENVRMALSDLLEVKLKLDDMGSSIIYIK
ncbi:MAG: GHMP family kinase ATP-binding protein [Leptospirillum sp.]